MFGFWRFMPIAMVEMLHDVDEVNAFENAFEKPRIELVTAA
jgi:hypothetical protein